MAILLQSIEKLILCIPVVLLLSLTLLLNKKLIKLHCFMNQISILTWCPQALENLQIRYPTHVQKRFSKFRKLGSRNLPLPWSSSFSGLLSPLPTPLWTFRSASMDFFFLKKNIYFYLFGCVASYLQHKRSLLFIMDVGSSSLIRDKTRTPCIGSTESEPLDSQGRSSMDFWRTAKQVT